MSLFCFIRKLSYLFRVITRTDLKGTFQAISISTLSNNPGEIRFSTLLLLGSTL